jgi:hypothetical protein
LSKTYKFGPEEISTLEFGEVTAREMGELPAGDLSTMRIKDFYPIACMLTGRTQAFLNILSKEDITKVVEKTCFLLGN